MPSLPKSVELGHCAEKSNPRTYVYLIRRIEEDKCDILHPSSDDKEEVMTELKNLCENSGNAMGYLKTNKFLITVS